MTRYGDQLAQIGNDLRQQNRRRTNLTKVEESNGHSARRAFSNGEQQSQLESRLQVSLPLIAQFLNLSNRIDDPSPMASAQQRRRLLFSLVEWVLAAAQAIPLVIVIEDLHWTDPSTLELLEFLIQQCAKAPLMLLHTARPEFRAGWQPSEHLVQITLNSLNTNSSRTMVQRIAGATILPDETITTVVERTGGVPLFVEELTRAVLESGDVKHAGGAIPATLHDSLMARLDRLGPARETLQLGAVLGSEFAYELLLAVTPLNDDELQHHLSALTAAALVYSVGLAPNANYRFKHALVRDAAYEALLKTRRGELHIRIARTMEERFSEQAASRPEILAHQYTEAGLTPQAVRYWRKAGQKASERSANIEAITQLRKRLELLRALPLTSERLMEDSYASYTCLRVDYI